MYHTKCKRESGITSGKNESVSGICVLDWYCTIFFLVSTSVMHSRTSEAASTIKWEIMTRAVAVYFGFGRLPLPMVDSTVNTIPSRHSFPTSPFHQERLSGCGTLRHQNHAPPPTRSAQDSRLRPNRPPPTNPPETSSSPASQNRKYTRAPTYSRTILARG